MKKILLTLMVLAVAAWAWAGTSTGPSAVTKGGTAITWTQLIHTAADTSDIITTQGYHWLDLFGEVVDSNAVGTDSVSEVVYYRIAPSSSDPDSMKSHVFSPDSTGAGTAAGTKSYVGQVLDLARTDADTIRVALKLDVQHIRRLRVIFLGGASNQHGLHKWRYFLYDEQK